MLQEILEKFEYFPIKCRTKRACDLYQRLQLPVTPSSKVLVVASSVQGKEEKKPLKSKV
jgi:hypothetical protein